MHPARFSAISTRAWTPARWEGGASPTSSPGFKRQKIKEKTKKYTKKLKIVF
jgi:hypothetical protein